MSTLIPLGMVLVGLTTLVESFGYRVHTMLGLAFLCAYLGSHIYKKFGPLIAAIFIYVTFLSFSYIGFPFYWWPFKEIVVHHLQAIITESTIYFILFFISFSYFRKNEIITINKTLHVMAIINTIIALSKMACGYQPYFLFNNPAIDCAFTACCLPGILKWTEKDLENFFMVPIPPILFLILSKTSTGILGLGLSVGAYYWAKYDFNKKVLYAALTLCAFVAGIGWWIQGEDLLKGSGRYFIWQLSFDYWINKANIWIGTGTGSFFMYGPSLQFTNAVILKKEPGFERFFWMHNDWLQVLFEIGIIGLLIVTIIFIIAVWRARNNPSVFAGILTLGGVALTQMPLRWPLFGMLGAVFITKIFRVDFKENPQITEN